MATTLDPRFAQFLNEVEVAAHRLADDGVIPNSRLPLLIYPGAFRLPADDPASVIEAVFAANGWADSWRNGVYAYHHYHSLAHEVLGVFRGSATIQFGGERGITATVRAGDVVVIPAGVAHKNLGASDDFGVVGAYPPGQSPDLNRGRPGERPAADDQIARVPLPVADPVYGPDGPLIRLWAK